MTEYLPPHYHYSHIKQRHIIYCISALTEDHSGYHRHIDKDAKKDQHGELYDLRAGLLFWYAYDAERAKDEIACIQDERGNRKQEGSHGNGCNKAGKHVVKKAADHGRQAGEKETLCHCLYDIVNPGCHFCFRAWFIYSNIIGNAGTESINLNMVIVIAEMIHAGEPALRGAVL